MRIAVVVGWQGRRTILIRGCGPLAVTTYARATFGRVRPEWAPSAYRPQSPPLSLAHKP